MPCYHPLQGWRKQGGGLTFNLRDGFVDRPVTVSCGQCIGCRLERSRQWAVRCMHEASMHTDNCFVTLTYSDEGIAHLDRCIDPETGEIGAGPLRSLNKRDIQLFMKRLRKRTGAKIRYLQCGEYGSKTQRPHHHVLLFGFDFSDKYMFAENRRLERREEILDILEDEGFVINEIMDYTEAEMDSIFLEGTGSLLLDRANGKAYCALSPRADEELFIEFCEDFDFAPVIFEAFQTVNGERKLIYHTNVMMCLGETFAVLCADAIDDKKERKMVIDSLKNDDKQVILITEDQVNNFAGKMLEFKGADDRRYLVMSAAAHQSLTKKQITELEEHVTILSSSLDTRLS